MQRLRTSWTLLATWAAGITFTGCLGAQQPDGTDIGINTRPATFDEAEASLAQVEQLDKIDRAHARQVLAELQPALDELNHLVARVEARTGHVVSFYEPEPGVIAVSERGPLGSPRRLTDSDARGRSATDLYRELSPGAEPPEALVGAVDRQAALVGPRGAPGGDQPTGDAVSQSSIGGSGRGGDPLGESPQEIAVGPDGVWWRDNACFIKTSRVDAVGCLPNWANGGYAWAGGAKTSFFEVAPYSGDVSVRFQYEGSTRFIDAVFSGEWRGWWWHSGGDGSTYLRRHHRWDILNASGDSFHWTYAFRWTCTYQNNCNIWPTR